MARRKPDFPVPPFLTYLEDVVDIATCDLCRADKQEVRHALQILAKQVRREPAPWREHVFALALTRYGIDIEGVAMGQRLPTGLYVREDALVVHYTQEERLVLPLAAARVALEPVNLFGFVQTMNDFRLDRWRNDEFSVAGHLADAFIHEEEVDAPFARQLLRLVAWRLIGHDPREPGKEA